MPFARPTLSALRNQAAADIAIPGAETQLRYSNLTVIGAAVAGMSHLHYGYLDWIALQCTPFTATAEYLEAWAALKSVFRTPVTAAIGVFQSAGTPGAVVPAGATVVRSDGYTYSVTSDSTVSADGRLLAPVTAVLAPIDPVSAPYGTGAKGNCPAGTQLTLQSPIAGIQTAGVAGTDVTGGADVEKDDSLRARMLAAFQMPPQGGCASDYVQWALAVPGVTRAWVLPNGFGPGTVVLYVMLDISESSTSGIPVGTDGVSQFDAGPNGPRGIVATGDQLMVADALQPRQPVTALVYVCAPVPQPVTFTITGLSSATASTRAAISAAIAGVFYQQGRPGGSINLSDIEAAIAALSGTAGFVIQTPAGNISVGTGKLPVLGTITWG